LTQEEFAKALDLWKQELQNEALIHFQHGNQDKGVLVFRDWQERFAQFLESYSPKKAKQFNQSMQSATTIYGISPDPSLAKFKELYYDRCITFIEVLADTARKQRITDFQENSSPVARDETVRIKCKATTASGKPCSRFAGKSGYCNEHDPAQAEVRKEKRRHAQTERDKLSQVIKVIRSSCQARGWKLEVRHQDNVNGRYALVTISQDDPVNFPRTIQAAFDISIDQRGEKFFWPRSGVVLQDMADLYGAILYDLVRLKYIQIPKDVRSDGQNSTLQRVEEILIRFHKVAQQLTHRHDNRQTLIIENEYDVQDLLHALLKSVIDDIRPEPPVSDHAGSTSRADFLLKQLGTVVEAKMASSKLGRKQIGDQLILDIERYGSNPEWAHMLCLVYDPSGYVKNPRGLENDLNRKHGHLEVKVFVVPR